MLQRSATDAIVTRFFLDFTFKNTHEQKKVLSVWLLPLRPIGFGLWLLFWLVTCSSTMFAVGVAVAVIAVIAVIAVVAVIAVIAVIAVTAVIAVIAVAVVCCWLGQTIVVKREFLLLLAIVAAVVVAVDVAVGCCCCCCCCCC